MKYFKKLISFFSWKRDIFTIEVPTNCKDEQYGKTHSVSVDTWKPEPKKEDLSAKLESFKVSPNDPDLPF